MTVFLTAFCQFLWATVKVILVFIFVIGIAIWLMLGAKSDEYYEENFIWKHTYDQKMFASLSKPMFFYTRRHAGDSGVWVVVYPLDRQTKNQFAMLMNKQIGQLAAPQSAQRIECIKPTIKKRWKSFKSNLHYVEPNTWSAHHRDHKAHDSFIVYGSETHIKTVEQACKQTKFFVLKDDSNDDKHDYWAISESENLLFSVYTRN
ncbi:hypothetical protein LVJ82_13980 [Vitreoscilla massiliensis]|uniref:Uncharacterized protein n=1 Tax=Vitreoscilla massiliensis TaxID=1689272 RepID=A0ABY4DZK9_9NEIS|nr:hypothetical protein [Vitreoscilla massiliensis]UOO88565.1 hypothetical protein LVJ82_13980 [Vitreoscilla massiliensis]